MNQSENGGVIYIIYHHDVSIEYVCSKKKDISIINKMYKSMPLLN